MFLLLTAFPKFLARLVWLCEAFLVPVIVYLSLSLVKRLGIVHKALIATFSIACFVLSTLQALLGPFYHSVEGGLVMFVTNKWLHNYLSNRVISILSALFSGALVTIISFFPVLFAVRYWTMRSRYWVYFFTGRKGAMLVGYTIAFGAVITGLILTYGQLDVETKECFREPMENHYGQLVDDMWGYGIVAYKSNATGTFAQRIRMKSFLVAVPILSIATIQFIVTIVSALKMFWEIRDILALLSSPTQETQRQFVKCLLFQIIPPTICLFIPIIIVHIFPYTNLNVDFPSGIITFLLAAYPLVDSCILLYILSEYREASKKLFKRVFELFLAPDPKKYASGHAVAVRKFKRLDFV